ncbi:hypothetical protein OF83DRAFT_1129838 [Amylostereum chailletii]|nr:hypothetical protein OF83DRAFT_1129838 [Amylostereum chailletii]
MEVPQMAEASTSAALASTSMAMSAVVESPRPQAGPLPRKRGEIGYVEEMHGAAMARMDSDVEANREPMLEGQTHPADHMAAQGAAAAAAAAAGTSSTPSMKKRKRISIQLAGVRLETILALFAQLLILAGTAVGWAFATMAINRQQRDTNDSLDTGAGSATGVNSQSSVIFVHVAFGVVALAELVFLERRIFRVRAERYAYTHPGEMLPSSRHRHLNASMPMVPWQRPPLPTYAAALAQSGVGTGDVEDSLIARTPPPAYGKTRGSTLVLQGYLNNNLRVQARQYDEDARTISDEEANVGERRMSQLSQGPRPVSFRSMDSEWETIRDAERARRVEEALAAVADPDAQRVHLSNVERR